MWATQLDTRIFRVSPVLFDSSQGCHQGNTSTSTQSCNVVVGHFGRRRSWHPPDALNLILRVSTQRRGDCSLSRFAKSSLSLSFKI